MPNEDPYLKFIHERLEPDIQFLDPGAYGSSIAVSMKRIADSLEKIEGTMTLMTMPDLYGFTGSQSLAQAIIDGIKGSRS